METDALFERAERWLRQDPDAITRAELAALLERARSADPGERDAARADLAERFAGPLEFGTAGLRGLLGAGESRMNRAVVLRTTAGFARYLLDRDAEQARRRGVVVGFDGRRGSAQFAEDTACVLAAAGLPAFLSPHPCPTPLAAFAVTSLGAIAGVMITASHNPPAYNGYKAYWSNGAQIIPPHDTGIAAAIERAPVASEIPRMPVDDARSRGLVKAFPDDLEARYLAAVRDLSVRSDGDRDFPIVYTPLHGVGWRLLRRAMEQAGFGRLHVVPEQAEPDGEFPTVSFPNPEEKGALDLALALADRKGAPLVLANDPDADRLAVAVRAPSGSLVQLTGNQVGVLLGHYLLTEGAGASGDRLVLTSIVSSPMLGRIARELGVRYEETLTGFKWIANRAMELERETGTRFVFGYEEALGYTVGTVVRDKDGISAAALLAELVAVLRARGRTLLDELETLARRYGLFVSDQRSITMPGRGGLARIGEIMERLRATRVERIGSFGVIAVCDYQSCRRVSAGEEPVPLTLSPSNVLAFELEGGSRIIARPSGTEPKIKFYFDVREPVAEGEPLSRADERARRRMTELASAFATVAGID